MEAINFEQILLKTAFCCMASDGDIDKREVAVIENLCKASELFNDFNFHEEINKLVGEINTNAKQFLQDYFDILSKSELSENEEITLLSFALKTIYADEQVEYSEVKFFKNIRHRLKVSDEKIIENFKGEYPEIEDFLEEDIKTNNLIEIITKEFFELSNLPTFDKIILNKDGNNIV